jgi:uncharacterized protein YdhG (YjbR/CyaY superfamily)
MQTRGGSGSGSVDSYIAACPANVRPVLQKIRAIVRTEAPDAEERISYRMPAFFLNGAVIYYAAFAHHIGIFPPMKSDASLKKDLAPYLGPKGNLRFPLAEKIPYALIRRVVQARITENQHRAARRPRSVIR